MIWFSEYGDKNYYGELWMIFLIFYLLINCRMNYFYKLEYGVNFDPMVPEINLQGGYRAVLNEILKLEISSYLEYRKLTYNQSNNEFRELFLIQSLDIF